MKTTQKTSKLVALVGMPGAGKSEVGKCFQCHGYSVLRFGQIVLDEAIARRSVNEKTEREIRNGFRKKYGMGAMALLNLAVLEKLLERGDTLIDDMYSWEEYKIIKDKYGSRFSVVAVVASPTVRYARLVQRKYDPIKDPKAMHRPLTQLEARSRDFDQIERASQGGPIAMADHYFVNEGTVNDLKKGVEQFLLLRGK